MGTRADEAIPRRGSLPLAHLLPAAIRERLGADAAQLFLTSALILFVELLLIRWVPANVVFFGFFTNLLLMGSFLGIGVGILLGRRFGDKRAALFGPLLLATFVLVSNERLDIVVRSSDELFFGIAEHAVGDPNYLAVLPLGTILVAGTLAVLALPLGAQLRALAPLTAYGVDVGGALAGIALFSLCSLLRTPPSVWFGFAALLFLLTIFRRGERLRLAAALSLVTLVILSVPLPSGERWSPYYRIDVEALTTGSYDVSVNGIPHQRLFTHQDQEAERFYTQVYRWFPERRFARALIVGAGGGSDVAAAIDEGVASIDAVEIDPDILEVGRELHPRHPYSDPRVRLIANDGRNFLMRSDERYDLIVFGLPDSLLLVSGTANLRLESFLFTREAFAAARSHLSDDGVFVLYNYYREPWLVQKIAEMLRDAFGADPIVRTYSAATAGAAALAAGPAVSSARARGTIGDTVDELSAIALVPASDDWPFLYLREPGLPSHYVFALGAILLAALVAVGGALRIGGLSAPRFSPHFFALGAAFLLLETRSVTVFGLLFGTTWYVNALVFAGILLSILAAIAVNARVRPHTGLPFYVGLGVALAANVVVPPTNLLLEPATLRYAMATAIAFSPVFFANLVFTRSFREAQERDLAFAANLLGAVVGGALEYAALAFGYSALVVMAAGLYVAAYLLATRLRLLADRSLAS